MGAISGGSPATFQASIQQTELQNQAEVDQRREAQETLRAERQEQTQETNEAQEASSRSTEQAQNETRQANPNQRVGGNVDVSV